MYAKRYYRRSGYKRSGGARRYRSYSKAKKTRRFRSIMSADGYSINIPSRVFSKLSKWASLLTKQEIDHKHGGTKLPKKDWRVIHHSFMEILFKEKAHEQEYAAKNAALTAELDKICKIHKSGAGGTHHSFTGNIMADLRVNNLKRKLEKTLHNPMGAVSSMAGDLMKAAPML